VSFILDALRKSEHQRQKNMGPSITGTVVKQAQHKKSPWLKLVAFLLIINSFLVIILWRPSSSSQSEIASLQDANKPREVAIRMSNRQPTRTQITPSTTKATSLVSPTLEPSIEIEIPNTTLSNLPSLETLQLKGVLRLPPMRVDIHVYSDDASERFVFINMKKSREGGQLAEGPQIERITPDGVIMSWQGQRFVISKD